MIFKLKEDVVVMETESAINLRHGNVSRREVEFDKASIETTINELLTEGIVHTNTIPDELIGLFELGFLEYILEDKDILILSVDNIWDFFSKEDIEIVLNQKDKNGMIAASQKLRNQLADKYLVAMFSSENIDLLYAINECCVLLNLPYRFFLYDGINIFTGGVEPNFSGCFECFCKQLKAGKSIIINNDLINHNSAINENIINSMISCLETDLLFYKTDSLVGMVTHLNIRTFKTETTSCRRTILCSTCASKNNTTFQEQNYRSLNVIKEILNENI